MDIANAISNLVTPLYEISHTPAPRRGALKIKRLFMSNLEKQPKKHNNINLKKASLPKPKNKSLTKNKIEYDIKDKVLKQILNENPKIILKSPINDALNHLKNEIILNLKKDSADNIEKLKKLLHLPLLIKNIKKNKVNKVFNEVIEKLNDLKFNDIKIFYSEYEDTSCANIEESSISISKDDIRKNPLKLIYTIGHEIGHLLIESSPSYCRYTNSKGKKHNKQMQLEELICDSIGALCMSYFSEKDKAPKIYPYIKYFGIEKYQIGHPHFCIRERLIRNFLRNEDLELGNHHDHFNRLGNNIKTIFKNDIEERTSYKKTHNLYKNFRIALKNIPESEKAIKNLYETSIKNYYSNLDNRVIVTPKNFQKCVKLLCLAIERNCNIKYFLELFDEESHIHLLNIFIYAFQRPELAPLFDKIVSKKIQK